MLKKKKTTASGKLVLVKSVRRTRSHRMKFCVQRGLGALPSTSKRRGKSRRDFLLCGPVCINTGIACPLHLCRDVCVSARFPSAIFSRLAPVNPA